MNSCQQAIILPYPLDDLIVIELMAITNCSALLVSSNQSLESSNIVSASCQQQPQNGRIAAWQQMGDHGPQKPARPANGTWSN